LRQTHQNEFLIVNITYNISVTPTFKDARSVSFYPYNRSQILQCVEYTK